MQTQDKEKCGWVNTQQIVRQILPQVVFKHITLSFRTFIFGTSTHGVYIFLNFVLLHKQVAIYYIPPRHWNTGLVSSGVSLNSWGEGASLALLGHPSSDSITIKILYGVDVFYIDQLCTPSFPIKLVKTKSDFIVGSVETSFERWTLVVAVVSVDDILFFGFLGPDLSLWLHCAAWYSRDQTWK